MSQITFEYFLSQLKRGEIMDETCFRFLNEEAGTEHYIGCLLEYEKPYWAGLCDIPGGAEFNTAEDLVNAPIYNGQSIKDRWNEIRVVLLGGLSVEDYLKYVKQ